MQANNWIQSSAPVLAADVNKVLFVSDGAPNRALDNSGGVISANAQTAIKHVLGTAGNDNDNVSEVELIETAGPGTAQAFPDLPAYTPMKVKIKSYVVRTQDDLIREFITRNGYTVTETQADGLRYIRLKAGTGDVPAQGKVVKIKYIGRFLSSKAFDGNMSRTDSLSVTIGGTQTVPGFQMGIEKMRLGEKAVIVFPSALGYGVNGNSSIPGYTPLSFEIYVAKIE